MDGKKLGTRIKKIFCKYWYLGVILIAFFLRLPSLFEPFTYGDEGIYLTLGLAIRRGLVLYHDIHDNKPPLLYLLAALAGNFSNYRLLSFIWGLATIAVFYKLSRLLFPKSKPAVLATTFAFTLITSIQTFEGNVANAENFMLLPIIAGFYLMISSRFQRKSWFFTGVFFSLATLFKVPAIFDFAALIVFVFISTRWEFNKFCLLIAGFLIPILITFVYFASQGALTAYFRAAFMQNLPYLSSWAGGKAQPGGLPLGLLFRSIIVLLITFFLLITKNKISLFNKLIITWFTFSLFAALLSSRPYPHYLIQVLPALSLSCGLIFSKNKARFLPLVLCLVLILSFLKFNFWQYKNIPYYLNFYQFALGRKTKEGYFNYFGSQTKYIYQTSLYLKTHTLTKEKIFIWGNFPSIYPLSGRLPVGRYSTSYHIIDFGGQAETIAALTNNTPRYLVVTSDENRPFPELSQFIKKNYSLDTQIGEIKIFHRILNLSSLW